MSIWGNAVPLGGSDRYTPYLNCSYFGVLQLAAGRYASGFTANGRYIIPLTAQATELRVDWSQPWAVQLTAKCTASLSRSQVLFGSRNDFFRGMTIEFGPDMGNIFFATSSNGSAWTAALNFDGTDLSILANQWYTMTAEFDGTNFICSVSDGTTKVTKRSDNIATPMAYANEPLEIGGIASSGNHTATYAVIDLLKSYIKSDGAIVWGCDGLGPMPPSYNWNDNFVVNWDFADPANRGGAASYTSASEVETIDGWRIQGGTVDLVTGGIRLTRTSGSSSDMYYFQRYSPAVNPFASKPLTLSVIVDGVLHTVTFIMPSTPGIVSDSAIRYGTDNDLTVVYFDGKLHIQFFLRGDSANHIVNAIKLEVGSAQTLCTQVGGVWVLNKTMVKSEEDAKRLLFVS